MATTKLGTNQQLHELFKRVLDKPEHENKTHEFGDFVFMFSKTSWFIRKGNLETEPINGYLFTVFRKGIAWDPLDEAGEFEYLKCILKYKPTTTLANILNDLKEVTKSDGTCSWFDKSKEPFREQFTKYLNYLELSEKLHDKTEKRTTVKI
ncbi:hypothetical protein A9Y76_07230 [Ralstonia insidiosa]|uniref:Uncharacterized protein n=1 Tax=Ralstonia insidiosa TaxID=190721 RepID=A0A191ZW10_9RALS|nr:hypothetical protein [Ralstonia insidiosa]ANJ72271.1 hypothetical protein A9Y76_07230 [Ralstonia insidiosa]